MNSSLIREARQRRHKRIRGKLSGTTVRPRLAVFRSINHIYAQVIDDSRGMTLAAASTLDADLRDELKDKVKMDEAKLVGGLVARRLLSQGIQEVVFDRGGYQYHGRVKALAEAAREAGLKF